MIKLRPIKINDFEQVLRWSKDEAFCRANGWKMNTKRDHLYNWWSTQVYSTSQNRIRLAIEYKGRCIGYCDLAHIEKHTAELGIAIGESQLWGKGTGTFAAKCLMEYGTQNFGITTFYAKTDKSNHRSQNMLKTLEFEQLNSIGQDEHGEIRYKFSLE